MIYTNVITVSVPTSQRVKTLLIVNLNRLRKVTDSSVLMMASLSPMSYSSRSQIWRLGGKLGAE
jgi:hypothetical protein